MKPAESGDDEALGVLDDAASLDTTGLDVLGRTARVDVTIPTGEDEDLLADDEIVGGEVATALVLDEDAAIDDPADAIDAPVIDAPVIEAQVIDAPVIDGAEPAAPASAGRDAAIEPAASDAAAEAVPEPPKKKTGGGSAAAKKTTGGATGAAEPAAEKSAPPVEEAAPRTEDASAAASEPEREPERRPAPSSSAWVASVEEAASGAASETAQKATTIVTSQQHSADVETAHAASAHAEVELTAKRLGDQLGQASRESADLLTADRLLDPHQVTKPEPEGAWSHFLYSVSGRRINIGDGKKAKARKALSARIAAPIAGGARFVPVLSRKGGVGKTTVTTLLGMALADAREDRVIAVDANPDRGTLAERIVRSHHRSVRDLVRAHDDVRGFHDISAIVARDTTRLDVLASDTDPSIADAFGDSDYRDVADVAAQYYSLVLTDTGTGIVHSVMTATLDLADQLVIVSGLSVDEARLASETLTWLEANGHAEKARDAIVVLNQSTPGAPLVRLNELEAHFGTRVRHVMRVPYDPQIAGGGPIVFANLQPETRQAARELAALLVEGLRAAAA